MTTMSPAYIDAVRTDGAALITYIGLFDASGVEISSASYARQPVAWDESTPGQAVPTADLVFDMTAGDVVAAWHGMSALAGGTDYGGADLKDPNGDPFTFGNDGTFTLLASGTGITTSS